MLDESKQNLIDQYLAGTLEDQKQFDELIKIDSSFKAQVEKTRLANEAIHQLGLFGIAEKLDQIHKNKSESHNKLKNWTLGAGIVLIGTLGISYYSSSKEPSTSIETTAESIVSNIENKESEKEVVTELIEAQDEHAPEENTVTTTPIESIPVGNTKDSIVAKEETQIITEVVKANSVTIEPQIENKIKEESKTTCPTITLASPLVTPTCIGNESGSVAFSQSSIIGGAAPYSIQIYNNNKNEVEQSYLQSGKYTATAIDANSCPSKSKAFTIGEKRCTQKLDIRLSPTYQETWEYPTVEDIDEYTVYIRNRSGKVIFKKLVDTDFDSSWDGTLNDGTTIKSGLYFLEIKTKSEELFVGTVTVVE